MFRQWKCEKMIHFGKYCKGGSPLTEFQSHEWHILLANAFFGLFVKPHVSNKKLIITKLTFFEFSHQRCSAEKYIPKNVANFTGKHLCWSLSPAILLKRDSNMDFFSEICEIFKNTYFEEHQRKTDCFSNLKHGIQVFHNIFFFHSKFWSFRQNPDNESSSECILVEILCVLFTLMSLFASYWKKVQTSICSEILSYSRATYICWMEIRLKSCVYLKVVGDGNKTPN